MIASKHIIYSKKFTPYLLRIYFQLCAEGTNLNLHHFIVIWSTDYTDFADLVDFFVIHI